MAIWEDLVNEVSQRIDGLKQTVADNTPSGLGVDQQVYNTHVIPQQEQPSGNSGQFNIPGVQDLVSAVVSRMQPSPETSDSIRSTAQGIGNSTGPVYKDMANKVDKWMQGGVQDVQELGRSINQYQSTNPTQDFTYASSEPLPETPEQQAAREYKQQAEGVLYNNTVKPVAYMTPAALPIMANDFYNEAQDKGLEQAAKDFSGYSTVTNPDFAHNMATEPVSTAAGLLPIALLLHAGAKGVKAGTDYAKAGETVGRDMKTEQPIDPNTLLTNEADLVTTDPATGVTRMKTPEEVQLEAQPKPVEIPTVSATIPPSIQSAENDSSKPIVEWQPVEHQGQQWEVIKNKNDIRDAIKKSVEGNDITKLPDVPADYYFDKNIDFPSNPFPGIAFRGMDKEGYKSFIQEGKTGNFWTGNPSKAFGGKGRYILAGKEFEPYDSLKHIEDNGARKPEEVYAIWHHPDNVDLSNIVGEKVSSEWQLVYKNPNFDISKLNYGEKPIETTSSNGGGSSFTHQDLVDSVEQQLKQTEQQPSSENINYGNLKGGQTLEFNGNKYIVDVNHKYGLTDLRRFTFRQVDKNGKTIGISKELPKQSTQTVPTDASNLPNVGEKPITPIKDYSSQDLVDAVEQKINGKPNPLTDGFISQDVAPLVNDMKTTAQSIKNFLSPASVNDHTRGVADTIRDYNSQMKIDYLQAEKGLQQAKSYFDKMPIDKQKQALMNYQEGGMTDPVLAPLVDAMKNTTGNTWLDLIDMGKDKAFEEWFLPQSWKQTKNNAAILSKWKANVMNSPTGWLNKKIIPSYREGIKMGLEPTNTNPVDAILTREGQARRWIMGEKIKNELEATGEIKFVKPGETIPEENGAKWTAIQGNDNPLGPNSKGVYFARPEVTTLINNFLNKGWQDVPAYARYMDVANSMNQFQLLGGFHVGFTSFDTAVTKGTLGVKLASDAVQNMVKGNFKEAAGNIADAITKLPGPTTPFTTAYSGRAFINSLMDKNHANDPLVQAYKAGGGQIGLAKEFTTKYSDSLRRAWNNGNYVGTAWRTPFAMAEKVSGLILSKLVPWQKAGAYQELMKYELKRDPSLISDKARLRSASAKVIDTIDNRLGQVNWDNLFLKPEFKQSLFVAMRAPGWTGGTIREMGGGVLDLANSYSRVKQGGSFMTHRMAYDVTLPIASIAANYAMQSIMSDNKPDLSKDWKSLLFGFKDGQKDEWGNEKSSSPPSYMKDIHAWKSQPIDTAIAKQHPLLSVIAQVVRNRDYFGTEIRHADDTKTDQAWQIAKYAGKQFTPFGIRNAAQQLPNGRKTDGIWDTTQKIYDTLANGSGMDRARLLLPQIGINLTPKDISMTEAQKTARDLVVSKIPQGTRTQEQADKSDLKSQLRKDAIGQTTVPETILNAVRSGQITKDEAKNIWKDRNKQPLEKEVASSNMSIDDDIKIWSQATDAEKEQIRPAIVKKISNILHDGKDPAQRQKALQYYNQYIKR